MSAIAHSHISAIAPEIDSNMRAIAPKGSLFSFLFSRFSSLESMACPVAVICFGLHVGTKAKGLYVVAPRRSSPL